MADLGTIPTPSTASVLDPATAKAAPALAPSGASGQPSAMAPLAARGPAPVPGRARDWNDLKTYLGEAHLMHPQRAFMAQAALETIRGGIGELAKLGHQFHLVEIAPQATSREWPRMYYHDRFGQRTVANELEASKLEPGWRTTPLPEEAQPAPDLTTPNDDERAKLGTGAPEKARGTSTISDNPRPGLGIDYKPKPAMDDKDQQKDRISKGAGASTPTTNMGGTEGKEAGAEPKSKSIK